eukprot:TRINITY_DN15143_c0_g1_i1.p1 TRINITY_DN15143_c0_g1~~TRINITY_DN15143_c0_g1_i1.p1  ORF type:complete len:252 (-),score=72.57 TRINITY_DN15143_c0_g1_i1:256-1011(-)
MSLLYKSLRRVGYVAGRALRETGQALDRAGCALAGNFAYKEQLNRHRRIMNLYDKAPKVGSNTFIAPNASVIGDVEVGDNTSIWYGTVLRGDVNFIKVGKNTAIGDRVVVHVARHGLKKRDAPTLIGDNVVIAHGAMIHACTIEDNAMVDIGSTVLDGAVVSNKAILGPGSLLLEGQRVPTGELWAGSPAKFVRKLTEEEMAAISNIAQKYRELADKHDEYHSLDQKTLEMMKDDVYDNALSTNYRSERYF